MRTPIIGIPAYKMGDNSFGIPLTYLDYFEGFGYVRILSMSEPIDERLDLLVIPGGADVATMRYNAIPSYWASKPDPFKEFFDTRILPQYIKIGTPVFGICRGIQSIAVLFKARLIQHMYHETNDDDRADTVHEIELVESDFRDQFRKANHGKIGVNSMHHQCVSENNFPDCLEILGRYSGGKFKTSSCIEVLRHRELPIYAVQYHPEELRKDALSSYIIQELITRSKNFTAEEVAELKTSENNN
jgi:gamma-glutamyl-gamma-aminobutyrate hydrolase PuuD